MHLYYFSSLADILYFLSVREINPAVFPIPNYGRFVARQRSYILHNSQNTHLKNFTTTIFQITLIAVSRDKVIAG